MIDLQTAIRRLKEENLLDTTHDTTELIALTPQTQPWFVQILTGLGAWVGALFLCVALFLHLPDTSIVVNRLLAGLIMASGALVQRYTKSLFLNHLGTAMAVCGHLLLMNTSWDNDGSTFGMNALTAAIAAALAYRFFPSAAARFCLSATALTLISVWIIDTNPLIAGSTIPWSLISLLCIEVIVLGVIYYPKIIRPLWKPLAYTLITSLIVFPNLFWTQQWSNPQTFYLLNGVIVAVILYLFARHQGSDQARYLSLAAGLLLGVVAGPGVLISLLILLLGFTRAEAKLIGLGVSAILYYMAAWYYHLDVDLAVKSYYLMGTGAVMLILRALTRLIPNPESREVT